MMKRFWLGTILTTTAVLGFSPAWSQAATDAQTSSRFRASMAQVEKLRQRQDQESLVEQAQILQGGLPISETNPLRKAQPEEAERLLERALANPGPHWPAA